MVDEDDDLRKLMDLLSSRVLSNSARLGILIALYYEKRMNFSELLDFSSLPKSSLSYHLQVLQEEGLVRVQKVITINGVRTEVAITDKGREVVRGVLRHMRGLKE